MKGLILHESARGIDAYNPESGLLKSRMLFFTEEVTPASSNELIEYLLFLDKEAPGEEITLFISSPGGEVTSGLALYDVLRMGKSPIRTVCIGTAASMGAILFLAGDKRCMLKHSKLMIHDPSVNMGNAPSKALAIQETLENIMDTREILARIISERTGQKLRTVYSKTKGDAYFNAEDALDFGLATEILEEI